jgi:uncharacterized protein (DUF885 family)
MHLGLRYFSLVFTGLLSLILALSTSAAPKDSSHKLAAIADNYFESRLQLDPLEGSAITGDARYEDQLTISITPAFIAKNKKLARHTLQQLRTVDLAQLASADKVTYQVLEKQLTDQIAGEVFPQHLLPIDQYGGLPVAVVQYGTGQDIQPFKTVKNYENYLKRLNQLPRWIDQAIINMREGIVRGVVQPKALIESGMPAIKALNETEIKKSPFYLAINIMPETFSAKEKQRITHAYEQAIKKRLQPSAQKLVNFLETEYLPHTRASAGLGAVTNGADWYAYLVRFHTTTDMSAEQIHALGLNEVARIHGEMEKVQQQFAYTGSLTDFLRWQNTSTQFRPFKTEQEVLDAYAALNARIVEKLPSLFGRIPKSPIEIRPEPELTKATASDHYVPPSADGTRPGVYYCVIESPAKYRNTKMTSLFLHEGQPGHHYHIALQQEMDLPRFRKFGWITAYGEGWALYAETLGKEMGLYEDPNQYLGHLKLELVRAVRLVTDTGLHAKGWTREQTIHYMMDNEGIDEADARRATERYMAWPGQALAYKIGALKFQELRARAQHALGEKYSLRAYHDLVLSEGVLPLSILEQKVDDWIQQQTHPVQ